MYSFKLFVISKSDLLSYMYFSLPQNVTFSVIEVKRIKNLIMLENTMKLFSAGGELVSSGEQNFLKWTSLQGKTFL